MLALCMHVCDVRLCDAFNKHFKGEIIIMYFPVQYTFFLKIFCTCSFSNVLKFVWDQQEIKFAVSQNDTSTTTSING